MKNLFIAALLGGLIAFGLMKITASHPGDKSAVKEAAQHSAFDRVIASRTLRCAYAAYDPFLIVGTNKELSGIFHDVMEEAGKRLDIKIVWAEEVGYGNINTGFTTGRYDAFCAGLWPAGTRAANTVFSHAVMWDPVGVWVRGDDARFDGHMEKLNEPNHKIADIDGDATVAMANAVFPKAGRVTLSQTQSTVAEEVIQVTTGKADAVFQDYLSADRFLKNTPGSLKNVSPDKPVLIYPLTIGYNQHEIALRDMFNVVLSDMERDGTIGHLVEKYLGDKSNLLFQQKSQFEPY